MKLRASEYVSKAEGLKSSELSVRQKLEGIKSQRLSVQSRIGTLEYRLDSLYVRLEALESSNSDDEEGADNSAAIEAIMEEIAETQNEISENREEDAELRSQEMEANAEIRRIELEEQQTLSEIQDSADRENQNIALISAFGGDYSNVSAQAAGSFQQKLAQFSQAAQILGGTVAMGGGGSGGRAPGRLAKGNLGESGASRRNFYEAANNQRKAGNSTGAMGAKGSGVSGGVRKGPDLYAGAAPTDEPPPKKSGGMGKRIETKAERIKRINANLDDGIIDLLFARIISKKGKDATANIEGFDNTDNDSRRTKRQQFLEQLRFEMNLENLDKTGIATSSGQATEGQRVLEKAHTTEFEIDDGVTAITSAIVLLRGVCSTDAKDSTANKSLKNQILVGKIDGCVKKYGWKAIDHKHSLEEDLRAVNPGFYDKDGEPTMDPRYRKNCQRCVMALEARFRGADVKATGRILDGTDTLPLMNHPNGWVSVFKDAEPIQCKGDNGIDIGLNVTNQMKLFGDGARAIIRIQRCETIKYVDASGVVRNYAVENINGRTVVCDMMTRKEIDISKDFINNDFSEGVEIQKWRNTYNPDIIEAVLVSKKDGKHVCTAMVNGGHVFTAIQQEGKTIFCDGQTGKIIDRPETYFAGVKREETYVVRTDNLEFTDRVLDCCVSE